MKPVELPFKISEAKKNKGIFCCAYGCDNQPADKKGGLCHSHYARKRKAIDPVAVRYNNLVQSAKQRKKQIDISLQEFRDLCSETGYIITKGMRGRAVTIDRIINYLGYSLDNIQLVSMRYNIKKYHTQDKFEDVPF